MSRRVTHEPTRFRVEHDCRTHDTRPGEFVATETRRYENGNVLYVTTRCDGSPLEAWASEVEVITP